MASFEGCVFCSVGPELILAQTANFYVIREPFPLVPEGHRMIIAKQHFACIGELDEALVGELEQLYAKEVEACRMRHGQVCSYEHGRAGACHAGDPNDPTRPACHHMHLHVLPCSYDLHPILAARYEGIKMERLGDIVEAFYRCGDYLLFGSSSGDLSFYVAEPVETPPHHMRTLLSDGLGAPGLADWESLALQRAA